MLGVLVSMGRYAVKVSQKGDVLSEEMLQDSKRCRRQKYRTLSPVLITFLDLGTLLRRKVTCVDTYPLSICKNTFSCKELNRFHCFLLKEKGWKV